MLQEFAESRIRAQLLVGRICSQINQPGRAGLERFVQPEERLVDFAESGVASPHDFRADIAMFRLRLEFGEDALHEESGGKTRLTLAHSGFATDRHSDAEWGGWLNYLGLIRSLVEYGLDWLPPIKEITQQVALYYAAAVWAHQAELLGSGDEEWGES